MPDTINHWFAGVPKIWPKLVQIGPTLIAGAVAALAAYLLFALFRNRIVALLEKGGKATPGWRTVLAGVLRGTSPASLAIVSLGIAAAVAGVWRVWIQAVVTIVVLMQCGSWAAIFVRGLLDIYASRETHDHSAFRNALSIIRILANFAIWSIVLLAILSKLGVDITAMIAGLGIGGVAIGLAAQGIFADLFGSLSIVFDRPFVRGDFITFDDFSGTIENIGMKSTRIRALSGEQIVLSNAKLLQSTIRNYQRLMERRVLFSLGVTYDTPPEKMEKVPAMIKTIIESNESTRFDRCHFKSFGDFALTFEAVYFVLDRDYNKFMNVHQAINLEIMRQFAAEGISFAFPTQTLQLMRAPKPASPAAE